jgi:NAD(P)-dependent dehydrogenase (short-subunit alcohol dehydrogenase family)
MKSAANKKPIVVVTGANRGIGFEICRQLAERNAEVVLTARSRAKADEAIRKLADAGLQVGSVALDVTKARSIASLREFLEKRFKRVDVLINNAGIIDDDDANGLEISLDAIRRTLETNTLAPLALAQALAGLLRKSSAARVVNISSGMGALSEMGSDHAAYRISKTALNAVTGILSAAFQGKVAANSMCPGWVKTDMGGAGAPRDVHQGADTAVWLALDAPQDLTGKFLRDRKVIEW